MTPPPTAPLEDGVSDDEVKASLERLHQRWRLMQIARFLGCERPTDSVVPGHHYNIGDTWVGPPYEEAWRTYADAGLCGQCSCGWRSTRTHRHVDEWAQHLLDTLTDEEWAVVEDEVAMRGLGGLPPVPVRPWL